MAQRRVRGLVRSSDSMVLWWPVLETIIHRKSQSMKQNTSGLVIPETEAMRMVFLRPLAGRVSVVLDKTPSILFDLLETVPQVPVFRGLMATWCHVLPFDLLWSKEVNVLLHWNSGESKQQGLSSRE